ncbi:MAG: methyltransferase domain-containing protein [Myxococcales bacterium]|nr:methyltransferase domain-containing protein [Myxococcales bacterium]
MATSVVPPPETDEPTVPSPRVGRGAVHWGRETAGHGFWAATSGTGDRSREPLALGAPVCRSRAVTEEHGRRPAARAAGDLDWSGEVGRRWAEEVERYDRMLEPLIGPCLDAAALAPGDRVVDVGCGAGASTLAAARRVGPSGHVLGVDVSSVLLSLARRRLRGSSVQGWVTLACADAQDHPLAPASLDAVISRLGMTYFADPRTALANLAQALRPGGRLAFSCWQAESRNPWAGAPREAISAHLRLPPATDAERGPFGLADPRRIRERLRMAGFGQISVEPVMQPMQIGHDEDDAMGFYRRGGLSAFLQRVPPPLASAILDTLVGRLRRHRTTDGVVLDGAAWLVTARVVGRPQIPLTPKKTVR